MKPFHPCLCVAVFVLSVGWNRLGAQSAFEVLQMAGGSRSVSLGNAVSAETGSIEGALHNPATLGSFQSDFEIMGAFNPFLSATMAHAVLAKRLGSLTLAISGIGLFYEPIQGYVSYSGDAGQSLAAGDFVLGLSGAWSPGNLFKLPFLLDLGLTLRYAHQILDKDYLSALVGDAGLILGFRNLLGEDGLSFGIHGKNLGLALAGPAGLSPPFALSAGASYHVRPKKFFLTLKILADVSSDLRESFWMNVGAGFEFFKLFSLRAGYSFGNDARGPSVGAGARLPLGAATFVLDYALVPLGTLGVQQSLQIGAEFQTKKR
ncbi:MAG: hypothetical protein JNM63_07540 [Spirochaetia bacterium]|nr:hypothetical protein [Spirochaetia bacterium]